MKTSICVSPLRAAFAAMVFCTLNAAPLLALTDDTSHCSVRNDRAPEAEPAVHSPSGASRLLLPLGFLACAGFIIVVRLQRKDAP